MKRGDKQRVENTKISSYFHFPTVPDNNLMANYKKTYLISIVTPYSSFVQSIVSLTD